MYVNWFWAQTGSIAFACLLIIKSVLISSWNFQFSRAISTALILLSIKESPIFMHSNAISIYRNYISKSSKTHCKFQSKMAVNHPVLSYHSVISYIIIFKFHEQSHFHSLVYLYDSYLHYACIKCWHILCAAVIFSYLRNKLWSP